MRIAIHETGHAMMALRFGQRIQKVSLRETDSSRGTDKYQAFMKLEPTDPTATLTGEKAIQKVMIALGGYASEISLLQSSTSVGGDDLKVAAETAASMLHVEDFKSWVARELPIPEPSALDMIEDPLARAYVHRKLGECIEAFNQVQPAVRVIAEELYKRDELTGDEVSDLFHSYMRSNQSGPKI